VAADGQAAWILPLDESYRQSGPSVPLPTGPEPLLFEASSWSPDGSRLAGFHSPAQGTELPGVFVYSFEDQTYRRLTERGGQPLWLSDSRRLLYKTRGAIRLLDPVAAMDREVFSFPAGGSLASDRWSTYAVSEANDRIVFSKNFSEADVWLVRRSEEPDSD
jgi:hypothetical protein